MSIGALFVEQALSTPEAVALELCSGECITYNELLRRAVALARGPLEALPREALVVLLLPRGAELLVGVLGTLIAGGAFVPVDPTFPAVRIGWIVDDVEPAALLVLRADADAARRAAECVVHVMDDEAGGGAAPHEAVGDVACDHPPSSLAYVIFTSGSTGRPKGVLVEHRSAINVALAFIRRWRIGASDRVFQFFATTFDPSVLDYLLALLSGARLLLRSARDDWRAAVRSSRPTIVGVTPSALTQLSPSELGACRLLMVGGEALPLPLARTWSAAHTLLNVYGPTEATIWATAQLLSPGDAEVRRA